MSDNPDIRLARSICLAIRKAREESGLSQISLSRRAGLSRATLQNIEHFDGDPDIGFLKIFAAAREAGLDFGVYKGSPEIMERRLERERAAARVALVREKHFRLAAELAIGDAKAASRLAGARRMVELWRRNGACSERYIDAWSKILRAKPAKVAREMLAIPPEWRNAMFQNTPFGNLDASVAPARAP